MKTYTYYTSGTCSSQIDIEIENNTIKHVSFTGGCHGNLPDFAAKYVFFLIKCDIAAC